MLSYRYRRYTHHVCFPILMSEIWTLMKKVLGEKNEVFRYNFLKPFFMLLSSGFIPIYGGIYYLMFTKNQSLCLRVKLSSFLFSLRLKRLCIKGNASPVSNWLKVMSLERPRRGYQSLAISRNFNCPSYFLYKRLIPYPFEVAVSVTNVDSKQQSTC